MKLRFAERADKDYAALRSEVREAFAKQLGFLLNNLSHPSLRAKKYHQANDSGRQESIAVGDFILQFAKMST